MNSPSGTNPTVWATREAVLIRGIAKIREYSWHARLQDRTWDKFSNFIYRIDDYDRLQEYISGTIERHHLPAGFCQYATNRWYNHATSQVIEAMFAQHPRVTTDCDRTNRLVDFRIDRTAVDLKTTFMPMQRTAPDISMAITRPGELAKWYYEHQSPARFHAATRLFLVPHDLVAPNEEVYRWSLKRQFVELRMLISAYLDQAARNFPTITFCYQRQTYRATTDVLFLLRDEDGFSGQFFDWMADPPKPLRFPILVTDNH